MRQRNQLLKRGQYVRVQQGKFKGVTGTVVKLNGNATMVVPHRTDEVVLRGVGDLSSDAALYVVHTGVLRDAKIIYPDAAFVTPLEDKK